MPQEGERGRIAPALVGGREVNANVAEGSGSGVLRALQALPAPKPVFIVLTDYDASDYRQRTLALGADVFLNKSHDFERLPKIVMVLRHAH